MAGGKDRGSKIEDGGSQMMLSRRAFSILYPLSSILALCSGCNVLGFGAAALPPPMIRPRYQGLRGQTVGVLVWADRGIRIDWNTLPLDAANGIHNKLKHASAHELDKTMFPVEPASILRYQQDHPDIDAEGALALATHLGVTRLIYVE